DGRCDQSRADGRHVTRVCGTNDRQRSERRACRASHGARADGGVPHDFLVLLQRPVLIMDTKRRKFLLQTAGMSAASLVGTLSRWGSEAANAQSAGNYQALVCVFLYGGNDANNMIVPVTNYAQYAAVRTPASNVSIPQANLINFTAASQGGQTFGFHPSFTN